MEKYLFLFWIVVGVGLLFAELIVFTEFYLIFFGIAAILTGVLAALGILPSLTFQIIAVIAFALLLVVFRKQILAFFPMDKSVEKDDTDSLVGTRGKTLEAITSNERGKVELRGSNWTAKNVGGEDLPVGEDFVVQSVDGLVLNISKE